MSRDFWNEKFDIEGFRYGTEPNQFVAANARPSIEPEGRVLCMGAGEGRNAVWLAEQGFKVTAVEQSDVGIDKMLRLADEHGVRLNVIHADVGEFEPERGGYDAVFLVYLHMGPATRQKVHRNASDALAEGGALLLEAFRPEQLNRDTGGPPDEEMLYTEEMLREDFDGLDIELLESVTAELDEGHGHSGLGEILRLIARKPA